MSINLDLSGQTAIVTGAGRGIGRATALSLAENGAAVVLAARTAPQIESVAEEITANGGTALPVVCDIAREEDIQNLFTRLDAFSNQLDIIINNAAIGRYGLFQEFSTSDLDDLLAVNVRGTYICCREALLRMIPQKKGAIINISSVVGIKGYQNQSAYTASKHAIVGMTKSLAVEAQRYNIRVSVIHPGGVDTQLVRDARPDLAPEILMQPEDIAHAILFLLSLSERCAVDEIAIRRRGSSPF